VPLRLRDEKGNKTYHVRDDEEEVDAAIVDVLHALVPQERAGTGKDEQEEVNALVDVVGGNLQYKYEFTPLRVSSFASPDEIKMLGIGDSIVSAGLLPGRCGEKRNYPFFKFGEISNIPDEPTWIGCGGRVELRLERVWFLAANLVAGNSGSPIFYAPPTLLTEDIKRGVVIGIQSSAFDGADIAGMTPIEDVFKIIEKGAPLEEDLFRGDETKRDAGAAKPR
jgi:hypothetical protein